MKGGLRGKWFSLILIAFICTTILVWAWENAPLVGLLPPQYRLDILSPVIFNDSSTNNSTYIKQKANVEEGFSYSAKEKETKSQKGKKNVEENLPAMSISSEEEKGFQLAPVGSTPASPPEKTKVDGDLMKPPVEEKGSVSAGIHEKRKVDNDLMSPPVEEKGCNYAKGKWVADNRWPLYSGFGCKQWLSQMWACRLTQRTDFSFEGFRWQPEECEMQAFDGSTFLERMQDKTVALVGDSLGRQQFQSMMCMITGGKDSPEVENVGWKYGLVKARGAIRPDGWAYRFPRTNTTILFYWSASLCLLEPLNKTDPATKYAMHLDRPTGFLQYYLHMFDVLVLNTGHHWNRGKFQLNRWVMYVGGKPLKDPKLAMIWNAKNLTIHSVVKWVDSQFPQHPHLKAFFRTMSPRHFVNGDWNTGGSCNNTTPLAGGDTVSQDESGDKVVAAAVKGTRVRLLDITAISRLRDEGHMSHYSIRASVGVNDCLHWCLPGIPDTWNDLLFAQL